MRGYTDKKLTHRNKGTAGFAQIKLLKCYEEVYQKVVDGFSMESVAKFIQQEKKELTQYKENSVIRMLFLFRASIPKSEIVLKRMPFKSKQLEEHLNKQVNVLTEYSKLYEIQMKRIMRYVEQEDTVGLNLVTLDQSIKTAQGLLDSIHETQSDLGLTPKNLGTLDIQANVLQGVIHKFANDNVAKVLENPVSRHKVLTVAERILALAAEQKSDKNDPKITENIANLLSYNKRVTIDADELLKNPQMDEEIQKQEVVINDIERPTK